MDFDPVCQTRNIATRAELQSRQRQRASETSAYSRCTAEAAYHLTQVTRYGGILASLPSAIQRLGQTGTTCKQQQHRCRAALVLDGSPRIQAAIMHQMIGPWACSGSPLCLMHMLDLRSHSYGSNTWQPAKCAGAWCQQALTMHTAASLIHP
jgi:hypothetical protein